MTTEASSEGADVSGNLVYEWRQDGTMHQGFVLAAPFCHGCVASPHRKKSRFRHLIASWAPPFPCMSHLEKTLVGLFSLSGLGTPGDPPGGAGVLLYPWGHWSPYNRFPRWSAFQHLPLRTPRRLGTLKCRPGQRHTRRRREVTTQLHHQDKEGKSGIV